jgi:hypothetical protein
MKGGNRRDVISEIDQLIASARKKPMNAPVTMARG